MQNHQFYYNSYVDSRTSGNKVIVKLEQEMIARLPKTRRKVQVNDDQDSVGSVAPSENPTDINQNEGPPNGIQRPILRRFPGIINGAAELEYFVMKDEITRVLLQKRLDHFEISMCHWGYEISSALPCLEIFLHEELKGDVREELQETFGFWKCEHLKRLLYFPGNFWQEQTRAMKEIENIRKKIPGAIH
jgi:hypothetical protein